MVIGVVLAMSTMVLAQRPRIERLPPVDSARIPQVTKFARARGLDDRDIVIFAGGAVELRAPLKWHVREVPFGREIRLVLAPQLPKLERQMPTDGLWLSCHVWSTPRSKGDLDKQLRTFLESRSLDSQPGWKTKSIDWGRVQLGKYPAIRHRFTADFGKSKTNLRGMHVAIRAPWGVCEIVAVAPDQSFKRRLVDFRQTLVELKIAKKNRKPVTLTPAISAAGGILGSWKAFRSRLRIDSNGRIDIITDRPIRLTRFDGKKRRPKRLQGQFRAKGDLVYVTWSDGSKLNFRWRLRGDDLLLTDHEGQISQLSRILE